MYEADCAMITEGGVDVGAYLSFFYLERMAAGRATLSGGIWEKCAGHPY